MQGVRCRPLNDGSRLELKPGPAKTPLSIDGAEETTENKIRRLVSENPVIIFSRSSCCMCHVMKRLLASLGVHPTVIELDDEEMQALAAHDGDDAEVGAPSMFIGGAHVGGLDSLMALHLSGRLLPKLRDVGAVWL